MHGIRKNNRSSTLIHHKSPLDNSLPSLHFDMRIVVRTTGTNVTASSCKIKTDTFHRLHEHEVGKPSSTDHHHLLTKKPIREPADDTEQLAITYWLALAVSS